MTDYRFVSNPNVALTPIKNKELYRLSVGTFSYSCVERMHEKGIIEPVPVEIPEHVYQAAHVAYWKLSRDTPPSDRLRAALIAAKQAENE